jgi:glycosyltransferase involved in cell wall biosynthesis
LVTLDAGPLFAVVVPSFNREDHIGRCLESLVRQSCKDFEVVVVDNASTDGTVDAVLSFDGRLDVKVLVNDSNRERSFSRNRGAEYARGVFVVFLDSDDELRPDSLELAAAFVEADPDRRFFFQRLTIVDESGATVYEPVVRKSHTMQRTLAEGNPLSCSGVFVERSLFLEHRFDEAPELVGSEDWHCWIRIAAEHEPVVCPGGGALLVDHSSRTISSDSWHDAEKRFTHLTVDLLADPATRGYLAPHIGLFHGTQAHYVAIKAAGQSAFRTSLVRFGRAIRHHPGLMFTRRTMHLFRLWLRGAVQTAGRTRDSEST